MQQPDKANQPNASVPLSSGMLRSVRRLLTKKGRDHAGQFLAEGPQAVREALKCSGIVQQVIVDDINKHAPLLAEYSGPLFQADARAMRQLSDTVTPQGVIAVCKQFKPSLDDLSDLRLVVVCAQVRDPGNAGTVIRCADAFGADAVILSAGSVELFNPKTVRASVGSVFHLPILTGADLDATIAELKRRGLLVLAADAQGESLAHMAREGRLSRPLAWLFGNEAWGLPQHDRELADQVVSVPMWGSAESLNLSSAAAVCLYASAAEQNFE